MDSFRDAILAWGTVAAFAEAVGAGERTAMSWYQRDSIPSAWFAAVVRTAKRDGVLQVDLDKLAYLAERRRGRRAANLVKAS